MTRGTTSPRSALCCDAGVQAHYAALLAQVIPVIGIALIVEMRQLDEQIKEARADAAPDSTKVGLVLAWLSFFAMASLAVSEGVLPAGRRRRSAPRSP